MSEVRNANNDITPSTMSRKSYGREEEYGILLGTAGWEATVERRNESRLATVTGYP